MATSLFLYDIWLTETLVTISYSTVNASPVFASMFVLSMSPLEICFSPKLLVMRSDTVPFPEPGGPIITARNTVRKTIFKTFLQI